MNGDLDLCRSSIEVPGRSAVSIFDEGLGQPRRLRSINAPSFQAGLSEDMRKSCFGTCILAERSTKTSCESQRCHLFKPNDFYGKFINGSVLMFYSFIKIDHPLSDVLPAVAKTFFRKGAHSVDILGNKFPD